MTGVVSVHTGRPATPEVSRLDGPAPLPTFGATRCGARGPMSARFRIVFVSLLALLLAVDAQRVIREAPDSAGLFGGITLGVHELGHVLWSPFGEFMAVAGGSLTQLLAPLAACLVLRRQDDRLGALIPLFWLASSLGNLSAYIRDARDMALDLVSPGDGDIIHDWNYLLERLDLLPKDQALANACVMTAWLVLLLSALLFARRARALWHEVGA